MSRLAPPSRSFGSPCACRAARAAAFRSRAVVTEAEADRVAAAHERRLLREMAALWRELAAGAEAFGACPERERPADGVDGPTEASGRQAEGCDRCIFYSGA